MKLRNVLLMITGLLLLVNLAPGPDDTFDIIAAPVEVIDRGPTEGFPSVPHYWIKPVDGDLRGLLRRYSEAGGTHHSALVMGDQVETLRQMARLIGAGFVVV